MKFKVAFSMSFVTLSMCLRVNAEAPVTLAGFTNGQVFTNPVSLFLTVSSEPHPPGDRNKLRIFDGSNRIFTRSTLFGTTLDFRWDDPPPGRHFLWGNNRTFVSETNYIQVVGNVFGFSDLQNLKTLPTLPTDADDIRFGCILVIGNRTHFPSKPLRVRLIRTTSYFHSPGIFGLTNHFDLVLPWISPVHTGLKPGRQWRIPVNTDLSDTNLVCPRFIVTGLYGGLGYQFNVYGILEEQIGTNWFYADRIKIISSVFGDLHLEGGGIIGLPATDVSANSVGVLSNLIISGPEKLAAKTSGNFRADATYTSGHAGAVFAQWSVPPPHTISVAGTLRAANVSSETIITVNANYQRGAVLKNASHQVTVVPNPFIGRNGNYSGLFYDPEAFGHDRSGSFTLAVRESGSYSASIRHDGRRLSMSGKFDVEGNATNIISRPGTTPITLNWSLDLGESDQVTGMVTDSNWSVGLVGDRAVFDRRTRPCTYAGAFTFAVLGIAGDPNRPGGNSYGTLVVNSNGIAKATCYLADKVKAKAMQSVSLSKNGLYPFHLNFGKGSLLSWLAFQDRPTDDVHGDVNWHKVSSSSEAYYPNGFNVETTLLGSRYTAPAEGASVLPLTNGQAIFSEGSLASEYANNFVLGPANKVTNGGSRAFNLQFTRNTGLFKGRSTPSEELRPVSFAGAVLQKSTNGFGHFLSADQSSSVVLRINPSP